jgi:hypothetical protein
MRGVPLKAVHELLGHAMIQMTMRYAHLAPQVTRDAVNLLDRSARSAGDKSAEHRGSGGSVGEFQQRHVGLTRPHRQLEFSWERR